jgi:hypothetical protein
MKTFRRLLGLARDLLPVLILLVRLIREVMKIVGGATNYRAAYVLA